MLGKIKNKIKNSGIIGKAKYGKIWQEKFGDEQIQWYKEMHNSCLKMHDDFKKFLVEKSPTTVLEIGCGAGYYPRNLKDLFHGMQYTGVDISETAIKFCKSKSSFNFIILGLYIFFIIPAVNLYFFFNFSYYMGPTILKIIKNPRERGQTFFNI